MEQIKKYMRTDGVLNLIAMGLTVFTSLYIFLIEHRLLSNYVQSLPSGENGKLGLGLGIGILMIFLVLCAVVMLAFALGELIVGLVLIGNAKKELRRTPIPTIVTGITAKLLSAAGFVLLSLFAFDTEGFSVFSKILYAIGLVYCVVSSIISVVFVVLIAQEQRALREEGQND